jgi:uncharacterized protein (TIGR00369 family)
MRAATAPSPDVAKPEALAPMTGREFMQALIDGKLPPPSIAETLSFRLVEVGDGYAVFEGETGPHLLNPLGMVHGGWVLTLIDSATGCAAHSMLPAGFGIATIETKALPTSPRSSGRSTVTCAAKTNSSAGGASASVMAPLLAIAQRGQDCR